MLRTLITSVVLLCTASPLLAMPPAGNPIPPADRQRLEAGVAKLQQQIDALRTQITVRPDLLALLPDVLIYHKAVDWPLRYGEILDVKKADAALLAGAERAKQLAQGQAPWVNAGGVRAYVSRIDGSIQPYNLFTPVNYNPADKTPRRLDFFFHGRNEKLTELEFISNKSSDSPVMPPDEKKFIVYPYGRYCCANKFAGEIDTLEILAAMKKQYSIDDRRIVIAGFSMGGAACWHHAIHYTDLFVAASPGAGFVDTRYYQKMDDSGDWAALPEWRKKLMRLYDCPDYALNVSMLPTISYAGDLDKQKAAGDVMEKAMADLGLKLQRIGAPNTPHKYSPEARQQISKLLDEYAVKGRNPVPREVRFVTYTLRYNRMDWVTIEALEEHWKRAVVDAQLDDRPSINLKTTNIAALKLAIPASVSPLPADTRVRVTIDGRVCFARTEPDKSLTIFLSKPDGDWRSDTKPTPPATLRKKSQLQGPIDDAFLDSFLIVRPTGKSLNEKVGQWCASELAYAATEWRKIFRGDARLKNDSDITDTDIASHNLILFGDPSSNAILAKIAAKLPIQWDASAITLGQRKFPADQHALIAIYPNPLNPNRYIVLNSGFTFRQNDHKSNAWQIAKLPDFAIIDFAQPPDDNSPGKIAEAGFFTDNWQLPKPPAP